MSSPRSPCSPSKAFKPKILSLSSPQPIVTITAKAKTKTALGLTPPPQTFIIHKGFICHYSKFFAGAFSGTSTEALTHKMVLENTDPHVFGLLVNWLYFQTIEHDKKDFRVDLMVELYDMANVFAMLKLQNDIISLLRWAMTDESAVVTEGAFSRCMWLADNKCVGGDKIKEILVGSMIWGSEPWIRLSSGITTKWMNSKMVDVYRKHYDTLPEEFKMKVPEVSELHISLEGHSSK
ncbi:hypothetical protein BKA61DRAFT_652463 [Leptodontidium sp. MPI-SDFR-AT-0119]|nr:hypothetical protein BKA61DRAFT_652463 [Leptodontidium sp. MPI-SDFR-AT-0119]